MALSPTEMLNGSLALSASILAIVIGAKIASAYFRTKRREYLLIGLVGILLPEPWWPSGTSFLYVLVTGQPISPQMYILIGNLFIPLSTTLWLIAFTDLLYKKKQKLIVGLFLAYSIVFEIVLLWLLSIDYRLIGELQGYVDIQYRFFVMIYLLSVVLMIMITGTMFSMQSLRSDNPELKMKGIFLLYAFWAFCVGALLDAAVELNVATLLIARVILVSSSISFYFGFLTPEFVKKKFVKSA